MLILTVVTGPDKGAVYRLPGDRPHRIGRRHGSVPLSDKGASSRHAEIALVNGLWTVTDLESSNGTYVNQHRITEPTLIEDGGRIQVGRTMLVFNVVDDAELAQHDDAVHESGSHATLHAALAAQERNQQLLTELRDMLASRTGEPTDERTHTGESQDAPGSGGVADLVRQVLDRIEHLKLPPAAKPEPDPRLDAVLDQLRHLAHREHVVTPTTPATPAPPVDLSPVLDELAKLREAKPVPTPPIDLTPVLDAIAKLREAQPKPAEPARLDLAPVRDDLVKLREAMPKPAPPVDLKPVLDAIEKRTDTTELKAKLDALLTASQSSSAAGAATVAARDAAAQAIAELRRTIDAMPARLDPSAALRQILDRLDAAANPQPLSELRTSIEQLGDRLGQLDRRDELARLADSIDQITARAAATPPAAAAPAPIDPTPKLDALHDALAALRVRLDSITPAAAAMPAGADQPDRFAALHDHLAAVRDAIAANKPADPGPALESLRQALAADRSADLRDKLDQLLDIATAPAAPAAGASDPGVAAKLDELRDAVAALAGRPAASQAVSAASSDVASIEHKLDAVIDVLAAMQHESPSLSDGSSALTDAALAELNAKLEVIYEALQDRPAPTARTGATSDEIDTLINLVQSDTAQANAEAALNKVLAKLDALAAPAPAIDHDLLERLELAARRIEKLNLPDVDLSGVAAASEQLAPMLRTVHDRVLAAEPVDLTAVERRLAELTETTRDVINHSDRPLLEQILLEVRRTPEAPDADKIELILERVGRIQDTRELEPLIRQMQESINVASNEKIVALLRQLIEHVQKMPGKFDGRDALGNIFESLRRLEQQQDQQGAAIRRLIASVADAESHPPAAPSPASALASSPRIVIAAAAPAAAAAPRSHSDADAAIEQLITGADPHAGRSRRRSLLITLLLIAMVPLAVVSVVLLWNEIDRGFDLFHKVQAPAAQPDTGARPASDIQKPRIPADDAQAPDDAVTKR